MKRKADDMEGDKSDKGPASTSQDAEDMAKHLKWLYTTKEHADCKILAGRDKFCFDAHKSILIQNSFFRKALQPDRFREGFENTIFFPKDEPVEIERMLCFLYTGDCRNSCFDYRLHPKEKWRRRMESYDPSKKPLVRLYALADKLDIPKLKTLAVDRLRASVPPGWSFGGGLDDLVDYVYCKTSPACRDIRKLMMDWVSNTLLSRHKARHLNSKALEKYLAIPEFRDEFTKTLLDGYAKSLAKD